eukprot:TRINITY_DN40889_c0_g1_i1.p1 TRINITY_DN40889_c0_g1~~TRINITY_DN40889_c0_g1_i1.p1  ORF type:complete len:280 (+),score=56.46 TRINITY_DN40889_c0_g1_i1:239-1078(+)
MQGYPQGNQMNQGQNPGQNQMGGGPMGGGQMGGQQPGVPFGNNAVAAIGMQYGSQFLGQGQQYVQGTVGRHLSVSKLKYYFNVNNSYVLNKLKIILCPFLHKSWSRLPASHGGDSTGNYLTAREDVNAPDLYIPAMAFTTYMLVYAYILGVSGDFHPEVLGTTVSYGLVAMIFELLVIKGGLFILNSEVPIPWLDLVAYSGYKYVGIIINLLVHHLFGDKIYLLSVIINGVMMGAFLLKTLKRTISPGIAQGIPNVDRRRDYFLLGIAALQLPIAFIQG